MAGAEAKLRWYQESVRRYETLLSHLEAFGHPGGVEYDSEEEFRRHIASLHMLISRLSFFTAHGSGSIPPSAAASVAMLDEAPSAWSSNMDPHGHHHHPITLSGNSARPAPPPAPPKSGQRRRPPFALHTDTHAKGVSRECWL